MTAKAIRDSLNQNAHIFVSTNGDDSWSGTHPDPSADGSDGPVATLEGAQSRARALLSSDGDRGGKGSEGPFIVEFAAGAYRFDRICEFTRDDSGEEERPIIYRAASGAAVTLSGGRSVGGFTPVDIEQDELVGRIDRDVRSNVVRTNLRDQGIDDLEEITAPRWNEGRPGIELFFKGRRMTLARWPNEEFTRIESIDVEGNTPLRNRVTLSGRLRGSNEGRFVYKGERPARWVGEKDAWVHGHWFWDWADQRYRIGSIDTERRVLELDGPKHQFGFREGQWYYAFNILSELDAPGEWYLDRDSGELYFWPPEPIGDGDVWVSLLPGLITTKGTSNLGFHGFTFEYVRETAVTISDGTNVAISGCTIRNAGSQGVVIDGGTHHAVIGCDISELGEGGIEMSGGDRATLTPANHVAENNHIHHCSRWNPLYHPGIQVFGVGSRVSHNLLYELPHTAIGFTGNDQVIEYNEIHSAVYMANDAGAIYTSPPTEEFSMYGHIIRYNFVHHLYGFRNRGCNGAIYLDDFFPGTMMFGNVFFKVPRAAFIGGGRYCTIENNMFVECEPSVHVDARGLGWAAGSEEQLIGLLKQYPYTGELWASRYPTLVNVLEDEPMVPKGNVIKRNICWKGSWDEIEDKARPHVLLEDNLVDVDPMFAVGDIDGLADVRPIDFELSEESPAKRISFERIPLDQIGIIEDELRASWPVHHTAREGGLDVPDEKTW